MEVPLPPDDRALTLPASHGRVNHPSQRKIHKHILKNDLKTTVVVDLTTYENPTQGRARRLLSDGCVLESTAYWTMLVDSTSTKTSVPHQGKRGRNDAQNDGPKAKSQRETTEEDEGRCDDAAARKPPPASDRGLRADGVVIDPHSPINHVWVHALSDDRIVRTTGAHALKPPGDPRPHSLVGATLQPPRRELPLWTRVANGELFPRRRLPRKPRLPVVRDSKA